MAAKQKHIYISAIEHYAEAFDTRALEVMRRLESHGYTVWWQKQIRPYEIIEQEIADCDALLALIDETWWSSTWMASEVTWAIGEGGAIDTPNPKMQPIPVFIYWMRESHNRGWLGMRPMLTFLERDPDEACAAICRMLER